MPNYDKIQLIAYGSTTSTLTQVLPDDAVNAYAEDAEIRGNVFAAAAEWTRAEFSDQLGGADTLKVFMAPEFYFRYGGPSDPPDDLMDSYPEGGTRLPNVVVDVLRRRLRGDEFTDWLFVPGTMFWHRPVARNGTDHPVYFNSVSVLRGGPEVRLSPRSLAANDAIGTIPTMGTVSTNQKQLMSSIDYSLRPHDAGRTRWDAALNAMFRPMLGTWEWLRWHIFTVQGMAGPGGDPLVFGLDVCLEHIHEQAGSGLGVLRTLCEPGTGYWDSPPEVNVHLLTSCGMSLDPARGVASRTGGYVARCDGMQPRAQSCWPAANFDRVIDIDPASGQRIIAPVCNGPASRVLPDPLQIGWRDGVNAHLHDPLDAVSVWQPVAL